MTTAEELRYVSDHLHQAQALPDLKHCGTADHDSEEKRAVFRKTRRYSKAEEAMHEDDRPQEKGEERRFSFTEAPTVVTTPYIWGHSVEEAPDQLHLLSSLRKEDEEIKSHFEPESSPPTNHHHQENAGRKLSFGEGGFGDHSAKLWNWPLGEHGKVEVHSSDKTFEAWLDFRPFEPNEVWAKVMGDELMIHCKSDKVHPGKPSEMYRVYTLPLNCDARTARFRIKFGHTLVVVVDKDLPIKLAVANFTPEESKKHKETVHAEYRP